MSHVIFRLLILLLASHYLSAGDITAYFDPYKFKVIPGTMVRLIEGKECEYLDYKYHNKVVFRVLDILQPQMNCLIEKAKSENAPLGLSNTKQIFFYRQELISKYFFIKKTDKTVKDNWLTIDPKKLELNKKKSKNNKYKYYIKTGGSADDFSYQVKKDVYNGMRLAKKLAEKSDKLISLNIAEFLTKNPQIEKCLVLLPKVTDENQCLICMDKAKNIVLEPCCHLCICDVCVSTINKCPLCRVQVENTIKIFQ